MGLQFSCGFFTLCDLLLSPLAPPSLLSPLLPFPPTLTTLHAPADLSETEHSNAHL